MPNQEAQSSKYSEVAVCGNNSFINSFIKSLFSSNPTDIDLVNPRANEFLIFGSMCLELSNCPAFTARIRAFDILS